MIRKTSSPGDLVPRVLGGLALGVIEYAGTVITACVIVSPRYVSASALSFWRTFAEISGGV